MKTIKGYEAMMELLLHYGVEYVFGIPGATEVHFMDALERTPQIKYILGLHEVVCVGAAEGYARAKGRPAVLNLHTGPGMAAAMPLLLNAKYGRVPMVIIVGQNDSRLLAGDPQLSGDIVGMAKPVVKWATEIYHAQDIPVVMHRAFKMAMQAPMGPVVVSVPYDLMEQELEFELRKAPELGYRAGRGDEETLARAAELIKSAEHPVLLVQEGVARGRAQAETVRLAELMGARVYQVWMGDVNFPVHHPLYCGDIDSTGGDMERTLHSADLLVGVGCQLFNDAFYSGRHVLPEGMPVIQVDEDPWELGKNFPVDCPIQGDVKSVLAELCALLEGDQALREKALARTAAIGAETAAARAALEEKISREKDREPIAVTALMDAVRACVSPDTLVVDDCWSSSGMLRSILELEREDTLYRPRNGGSIGFGLPGALGVKLARPDRNVLLVSGDGSAAWSMQAFWTAARYDIPVTMVITNNGTYRQVKNVRKRILGDYPLNERHLGMEIDRPQIQFSQLAASMGVTGRQVRRPEELQQAISEGLRCGKPNVVEVFLENRPD